jgi:hypothetical protein
MAGRGALATGAAAPERACRVTGSPVLYTADSDVQLVMRR